MRVRSCIVGLLAAGVAFAGACEKKTPESGAANTKGASGGASAERCPHEIKAEKCPFCNPGLVESEGFCGEHGVAEALCAQCRPYLNAAFRAKGDWCKEHDVPETQCVACHPELKEKLTPGAGHGEAHPEPKDEPKGNG